MLRKRLSGSTIVFNRESFHIVAANLDPWP